MQLEVVSPPPVKQNGMRHREKNGTIIALIWVLFDMLNLTTTLHVQYEKKSKKRRQRGAMKQLEYYLRYRHSRLPCTRATRRVGTNTVQSIKVMSVLTSSSNIS